jgi:predicted transposase YbfD/YdcC
MVNAIRQYFSGLPDPRHRRGRRHRLDELVIIAILAVICGADNWQEVAQWARAKRKWLKTFLELPHGPPSHDTFGRVFAAIHMISAWSNANGLVFGQLATAAKSNEITAIPKLLEWLDLRGAVISIDAMGCQKEIARKIVDNGGDYIFSLKGNQGTMHQEVAWWLDQAIAGQLREVRLDSDRHVDKNHGRLETRQVWCTEQVEWFAAPMGAGLPRGVDLLMGSGYSNIHS